MAWVDEGDAPAKQLSGAVDRFPDGQSDTQLQQQPTQTTYLDIGGVTKSHVGPGAPTRRWSSVASGAPSDSATAT